jgi:hypothetical protein
MLADICKKDPATIAINTVIMVEVKCNNETIHAENGAIKEKIRMIIVA